MKGESFDEMIERYKRDMMNISPRPQAENEEKPAVKAEEKEEKTPSAPNTQTGFLKVRVITDKGKTVQGASVLVTDREDENPAFRFFGFTDENGESSVIPLPAPPAENSLAPKGRNAYASYDVRTYVPGFRAVINRGVPIFEGVTSVGDVRMLPLPGETVIINEARPRL